MFQYKARIKSIYEVIAEGHTVEEVEKQVLHFRRQQKHGEPVEILRVERNKKEGKGKSKEKVVKII